VAAESRTLLAELAVHPDDADLRRRAAEALDAEGQDTTTVLAPLVNLTGHDADAQLPCLCTKCLPAAATTADGAGMKFVRSFAITGTRVLHFWLLDEQKSALADVRASVTAALTKRLALRTPKANR
jgi:hypothetical protein